MGFKLTYKDITTQGFNKTMGRIFNEQQFDDVKAAYKIKRLVKKLEAAQKTFYEMADGIRKPYLKDVEVTTKDAEGKETTETRKQIDPDRLKEYQDKIHELGNIEVNIEWHMLSLNDLQGVKLSPVELTYIEPILEEDFDALPEVQPPHTASAPSSPETAAPPQ